MANHVSAFWSCRAWNGASPVSKILQFAPDFVVELGDQAYNDYPGQSMNGSVYFSQTFDPTGVDIGSTLAAALARYQIPFGPTTGWRTDVELWQARTAGQLKRYSVRDDHDFLANNWDFTVEQLVNSFITLGTIDLRTATVTCTLATPAVFSLTDHGLALNQPVRLRSTITVPGNFNTGTFYYVSAVPNKDQFQLSATKGGASMASTSTGSGTITASIFSCVAPTQGVAIASPGTFQYYNHGLVAGQYIHLQAGSPVLAGVTANTSYKVSAVGLTRDQFQLFQTDGVTAVNITGGSIANIVMNFQWLTPNLSIPTTQADVLTVWRIRQAAIAAVTGTYDDNPTMGTTAFGVTAGDIPTIMQGTSIAGDHPSQMWYMDRGYDGTVGGNTYRYIVLDCISQKDPMHTCEKAVFTTNVASPGVITIASAGQFDVKTAMALRPGDAFTATTAGTLPPGMNLATTYYVLATGYTPGDLIGSPTDSCSLQFALTPGGAAINITGAGSGSFTLNHTKTMLGASQKAAVKAAALDAKLKNFAHVVIVSSKDYGQVDNGDAWVNYRGDRDELLTYFQANNIPTIHITADRHHPHGGAFEVANGDAFDAWFMQPCPMGEPFGALTQYAQNKFSASRSEFNANTVVLTCDPVAKTTKLAMISLWDMSVIAAWVFPWGSRTPSQQTYMPLKPVPVVSSSATQTIAVGASPFVYKNATGRNAVVNIIGGTVSAVGVGATAAALDSLAATTTQVMLRANDVVQVTYTVAPTMKAYPLAR